MDNPTTRVLRQEAAFARGLFYISLAPLGSGLAGLFLQRFFDVDPAQAPDFAFPLNMPFLAVTYLPQAVIGAAVISAIAAVHALRSTARVRTYIRRFGPDAQFARARTRP
ncbi:hypothetical protein [Sphingomonas sp. TX0522]|uniref:hypothetical protein n=1 Tax=Sphingomonas sp. TX0522 TaxID=2479205 RepID=UPI0018DEFCF1|nr:hypothetical protein [Sphingomonas sp. TX0522]MBI0533047.1 hypothetical protein [Sphingomonas sp. TX0522]